MHAGRQAVIERASHQQRRVGVAHGDKAGADHHRGLLGNHGVGELYGRLRARLVVVIDKFDVAAGDAAFLVGQRLERFQRLLLALAEKRAAARQRHDNVDFVGIGGVGRSPERANEHGRGGEPRECLPEHLFPLPDVHSTPAPPNPLAGRPRPSEGGRADPLS